MENGVHFTKNQKWLDYDNKILTTDCESFEMALDYAQIYKNKKWHDGFEDYAKQIHKENWIEETNKWIETGNKCGKNYSKIPLFAGIAYCAALLPFEFVEDDNEIPTTELKFINWFRDYYSLPQIDWARAPKCLYSEQLFPLHPGAFEEWMNHNHNKSTWWINWCAYERKNNIDPFLNRT